MFDLHKIASYAVIVPPGNQFLIVEDGTGRVDANSYLTYAEADAFLRFTPYAAIWSALQPLEKEGALIFATELMNQKAVFNGKKKYPNAALKFPRTGLQDCEGNSVSDELVPTAIKKATALVAAHYSNPAVNPYMNSGKLGLTELTADVVTLRFQEGFNATSANAPINITGALDCLGRVSFGRSNFVPIVRA